MTAKLPNMDAFGMTMTDRMCTNSMTASTSIEEVCHTMLCPAPSTCFSPCLPPSFNVLTSAQHSSIKQRHDETYLGKVLHFAAGQAWFFPALAGHGGVRLEKIELGEEPVMTGLAPTCTEYAHPGGQGGRSCLRYYATAAEFEDAPPGVHASIIVALHPSRRAPTE